MARIGSFGSDQPRQPGGAVPGKPALSGSKGDTGVTGHRSSRDTGVEVWLEHDKTPHGFLARFLGAGGQRRDNGVLLIHDAHSTLSTAYRCPEEDRRTDTSLGTVTRR
jgi:hypothetical protein